MAKKKRRLADSRGPSKQRRQDGPTIARRYLSRLTNAGRSLDRLELGVQTIPIVDDVCRDGASGDIGVAIKKAARILVESSKVFLRGNDIVVERSSFGNGRQFISPIAANGIADGDAVYHLGRFFLCSDGRKQFYPPAMFARALLNDDALRQLPRIAHYSPTPTFDQSFTFCGPGYHRASGLLVHGERIVPARISYLPDVNGRWEDCLPPRLSQLLGEFAFAGKADVANYLGALLTSVLIHHFVKSGKPLILINGNQPGLGKTLLVEVASRIADERLPTRIDYTANEEEFAKRIGAAARLGPGTLLIDNAKTGNGATINSAALEANVLSETVQARILGRSDMVQLSNDYMWWLTANDAKVSPDLVSRSMVIRLHFEGLAENRRLNGDPISFVARFRNEIVAELLGMIKRWDDQNRPRSEKNHRCRIWASIVGGILEANGFAEFLENSAEAAASINATLDLVAPIAERVCRQWLRERRVGTTALDLGNVAPTSLTTARSASAWSEYFETPGARSNTRTPTETGQFLTSVVDRPVQIEMDDFTGTATLRRAPTRANRRLYWFEFVGDIDDATRPPRTPPDSQTRRRKRDDARAENTSRSKPVKPDARRKAKKAQSLPGNGNDENWDD